MKLQLKLLALFAATSAFCAEAKMPELYFNPPPRELKLSKNMETLISNGKSKLEIVVPEEAGQIPHYAGEEIPFTRIHEFKHYHPERKDTGKTIIFKEYSRFASPGDEPYYPVLTEKNRKLHQQYLELAETAAGNVIFGGRLGQYRYSDMDDTIAEALSCYENTVKPKLDK